MTDCAAPTTSAAPPNPIEQCTNDRYGVPYARTGPHDGTDEPHRNGELIWHDPPLLLVDGKPVPPITPRELALLAALGAVSPPTTTAGQ